MSNKNYIRYFMVATVKNVLYIKLQSDLPFLIKEGRQQLQESYPKAKKITHLNKEKAEKFLELFLKIIYVVHQLEKEIQECDSCSWNAAAVCTRTAAAE